MTVIIGPLQENQGYETRQIAALGSLILDSPLNNTYPAGTKVVVYGMSEIGVDKGQGLGPNPGSGSGSGVATAPGQGLAVSTGYTLGGLTLPSFTGTTPTYPFNT